MFIVSQRIRELRKSKGLTQKQLAKILGCSPSAVSNWEQGIREPNISCLIDISIYFNCSIDFLLGLSDEF